MILKGKTAIVTGGSRGIGKSIGLKLAEEGCNIMVADIDYDAADLALKDILGYNVKGEAFKCDVSNSIEVESMISTCIEKLGSIDILVNNAGITRDNLLMRMDEDAWDDVIRINLKGVYNCTKAVSRHMIKNRYGKILNVASVIGITGNAGQSNYSASKAGIIGFTKSIAKELGIRGINVNAIAPGFIKTNMTDSLHEKIKTDILDKIPLKRFGEADEVADLVVFLVSDKAKYITGQIINVDGGMVM